VQDLVHTDTVVMAVQDWHLQYQALQNGMGVEVVAEAIIHIPVTNAEHLAV
jgi:hypothetical protein